MRLLCSRALRSLVNKPNKSVLAFNVYYLLLHSSAVQCCFYRNELQQTQSVLFRRFYCLSVGGGWRGWRGVAGRNTASDRLVGGEDLVNPATELGDAGVDSGGGGGATAASPGDDSHQSPGSVLLTDQRATRVTLETTDTVRDPNNTPACVHVPNRDRRKSGCCLGNN